MSVPADGCTALAANSLTNKIAIISRGTGAFTVKVLNAQNAGAKGVITQNSDPGNFSFAPGGTERKVKIPSGMLGNNDGAALRAADRQSVLHEGREVTRRALLGEAFGCFVPS